MRSCVIMRTFYRFLVGSFVSWKPMNDYNHKSDVHSVQEYIIFASIK